MEQSAIAKMVDALNRHIAKRNLVWSKGNDPIIAKHQHNDTSEMDAIVFFPLNSHDWRGQIGHINVIESGKVLFARIA